MFCNMMIKSDYRNLSHRLTGEYEGDTIIVTIVDSYSSMEPHCVIALVSRCSLGTSVTESRGGYCGYGTCRSLIHVKYSFVSV